MLYCYGRGMIEGASKGYTDLILKTFSYMRGLQKTLSSSQSTIDGMTESMYVQEDKKSVSSSFDPNS